MLSAADRLTLLRRYADLVDDHSSDVALLASVRRRVMAESAKNGGGSRKRRRGSDAHGSNKVQRLGTGQTPTRFVDMAAQAAAQYAAAHQAQQGARGSRPADDIPTVW